MKIKISPLTFVLIAVSVVTKQVELLFITYIIMTVHELSHLLAAVCIGLKPESISFAPFGVHLTLKNKIIRGFADEIILYSAGPLVNAVFAVISIRMGWYDLYKINTALFLMNMLPVVPLDGGIILKRVLSYKIGKSTSDRIMRTISAVLSVSFLTLAIVGVCKGYINPSLFVMAVFLTGNLITGNELYNVDFINGISNEKKRNNKTKLVIVDENNSLLKAAENISPAYTTVAIVTDKEGRVRDILTDRGIQKGLSSAL